MRTYMICSICWIWISILPFRELNLGVLTEFLSILYFHFPLGVQSVAIWAVNCSMLLTLVWFTGTTLTFSPLSNSHSRPQQVTAFFLLDEWFFKFFLATRTFAFHSSVIFFFFKFFQQLHSPYWTYFSRLCS